MANNIKRNRELGGVSMMSVMFFVLFLSILAVSFLRITNDEKQRSLRNELSTAALSAAEAGIEDAKRVLLYCMDPNNANTDPDCQGLESASCTDIINNFSDDADKTAKKIIAKSGSENNGDAIVDATTDGNNNGTTYQQYYTCLQINRYTKDLEFSLPALDSKALDSSASVVIPMTIAAQTQDGYKTNDILLSEFTLQWHLVGGDQSYDGSHGSLKTASDTTNPPKDSWEGPAMMRIEMVSVSKEAFTLDQLDQSTYAVILRPTNDGYDSDASNALKLSTYAPKTNPNESVSPIQNVKCADNSVNSDGYQCWVKITYNDMIMNPGKFNYYIRLTSLYRDAHVSIGYLKGTHAGTSAGMPGDDKKLVFNALQPTVDVTGRVNNTYRRLIARVAPNASLAGDLFFPEYAIESGSDICKKMVVDTAASNNSQDLCSY